MPGRVAHVEGGGACGFLAVTDDVSELTKVVEGKSHQKEQRERRRTDVSERGSESENPG